MSAFALRYSNTLLTDLAFDSEAVNQVEYEGIEFFPPKIKVEAITGTTKRGRRFQHNKFILKDYNLVISSDEIDDDCLFLKSFWEATYKYIAVYNESYLSVGGWNNYELVVTAGGEFPVSFDEDLIFPEVALTLMCVEPEI
jgi:hypothetical protein